MLTYSTSDGDMVDDIVLRHYGAINPAMVRQVMDANPGIAEWVKLPAGVIVLLPDIEAPAGATTALALWD